MTKNQLRQIICQSIKEVKQNNNSKQQLKKKKKTIKQSYQTSQGRKFDQLFRFIGEYEGFHEFIADNPGCGQAIIE